MVADRVLTRRGAGKGNATRPAGGGLLKNVDYNKAKLAEYQLKKSGFNVDLSVTDYKYIEDHPYFWRMVDHKLRGRVNEDIGGKPRVRNIKFALEVDPNNKKLKSEFEHVQSLVKSNTPSLPTTIEKELDLNPFLRCNTLEIQKNIIERFNVGNSEFEIFTAIRKWKDNY